MPIYEFYCADCHTIYNFFSLKINTETVPKCPRCENPDLKKQLSVFSVSKGGGDETKEILGDIDEDKMERALASLAKEMEGVEEDDPKHAARLIRKLYDTTGLKLGSGMEEAMRRMEAGEDPDQIDEEMGDILEHEDPFAVSAGKFLKDLRRSHLPPSVDETLYDLK